MRLDRRRNALQRPCKGRRFPLLTPHCIPTSGRTPVATCHLVDGLASLFPNYFLLFSSLSSYRVRSGVWRTCFLLRLIPYPFPCGLRFLARARAGVLVMMGWDGRAAAYRLSRSSMFLFLPPLLQQPAGGEGDLHACRASLPRQGARPACGLGSGLGWG